MCELKENVKSKHLVTTNQLISYSGKKKLLLWKVSRFGSHNYWKVKQRCSPTRKNYVPVHPLEKLSKQKQVRIIGVA